MKVKKSLPPNYKEIKQVLDPPSNAVFAYGDIIYNPSGGHIWPDLEEHEDTHRKQQERYGSIELWWSKYIYDESFRERAEVEAYKAQYNFLRKHMTNKDLKQALFEMADALSSHYKLYLTYQEAEQRIRK